MTRISREAKRWPRRVTRARTVEDTSGRREEMEVGEREMLRRGGEDLVLVLGWEVTAPAMEA